VFESNQKSFLVFAVHSANNMYRSEQLRALNSETIPDLEAFAKLGFPLKQTVKVHLTDRQAATSSSAHESGAVTNSNG